MDWAQVLVILISIVLLVFLMLAITLVVLLIRVTREIKAVTDNANRVVHNVDYIISGVSKIASPLVLAKLIAKYIKKMKK